MIRTILSFIKSHRYAVIWTIAYTCAMWAILYYLFNFDMFNGAQWHRLMRAQLRGFGGFVFGLLILSAIPLYVATTTLIIRTKKPLITIPKIKIKHATKSEQSKPDSATSEKTEPKKTIETIPNEAPLEMRTSFLRAQNNLNRTIIEKPEPVLERIPIHTYATNDTNTQNTNTHQTIPQIEDFETDTFPLPTDFDIDIPSNDSAPIFSDAPVFSDINFDSPAEKQDDTQPSTTIFNNDEIKAHLDKNNIEYTDQENIIQTTTHAIISHTDTDFWVSDTDTWFATGKSIPSPIKLVKQYADKHHLNAVLYLSATNILDLETNIKEWESNGITVITDINEIK